MQRTLLTLRDDLAALALVGLMMLVAAWAVTAAQWAEGLDILPVVVLIAVAANYLLSLSRFPGLTGTLISLVYGLFTVWALVGGQIAEPLTFRERLMEVSFRLGTWIEQAVSGGFSRDNLIFLLFVGLLAWLLTFSAVWNVFRLHRLWQAAVPGGLALLVNAYYYLGPANMKLFVAVYLFLTLALAVQTHIVQRERLWRRQRVGFHPSTRFDLMRGGLAAAAVLLGLAWLAPTAQASHGLAELWERSDNPWRDVQETFDRMFNALEGRAGSVASYYGGATLAMGGPIHLSDNPVMTVYAPQGYRYYWRSKVFEQYFMGRWWTNAELRITSDFGQLRPETNGPYSLRRNVQQRVEVLMPATRLLYAAPQPVSFASLPIIYEMIPNLPGSEAGTVTVVQSSRLLEQGATYGVTSSISIADETSLRLAGTEYPLWVKNRYLLLPENISPRTRELARQLAAPYTNPYDVARAIELYLRTNITYNEQVAAPPNEVEPVDYVLFERQEGYCTYYASAMAVLLRSVGIPARIAVGFAQGAFDPEISAYVVAESDAHTWVEVYFPEYGWVEFEPTAAQQPILRSEQFQVFEAGALAQPPQLGPPTPAPTAQPPTTPGDESEHSPRGAPGMDSQRGPALLTVLRGLLATALVIGVIGAAVWTWMKQHGLHNLTSDVARSYARLNIAAPLAGVDLQASDTPCERAEAYRQSIPEGDYQVKRIVDLYVQEQYTEHRLSLVGRYESYRQAREAWQRVWPLVARTALERLLARLNPFAGRSTGR